MVDFFEDPVLGSAFLETRALGLDFLEAVMTKHCVSIESNKIDHLTLQPFTDYHGIEIFLAALNAEFTVFAVQVDSVGDKCVTIMFSGIHGTPIISDHCYWNGSDYLELTKNIIIPRAKVWFT